MTDLQLTIDGRAVPAYRPDATRERVSRGQAAILHHIHEHGSVTSTRAGVILHQHRRGGCKGAVGSAAADRWTPGPRSEACCPWSSADGWASLKRLADRGLVHRHSRGVWHLGPDRDEAA